jgi:AcrR family transcriptional regulator
MVGPQANAQADRRAARRDALLAAGLELFGTRGYDETTVEDVCAEARLSTDEFEDHFSGTEGLLAAVHEQLAAELMGTVAAALELESASAGVERRARAGIAAFVQTLADDERKARVQLLESVGATRAIDARRREVRRAFAGMIARGGERAATAGEIPRRDFGIVATALVGALYEVLVEWLLAEERPPIDEVIEECVRLFVAAATAQ